MQTISETLGSRQQLVKQLPTGFNKVKTTDNCTTDTTGSVDNYWVDLMFDDLSDLVNSQFKAWYCKMFYKIGRRRVVELAAVARADGKQPSKLFSLLLKRAVNG